MLRPPNLWPPITEPTCQTVGIPLTWHICPNSMAWASCLPFGPRPSPHHRQPLRCFLLQWEVLTMPSNLASLLCTHCVHQWGIRLPPLPHLQCPSATGALPAPGSGRAMPSLSQHCLSYLLLIHLHDDHLVRWTLSPAFCLILSCWVSTVFDTQTFTGHKWTSAVTGKF